MSKDEPVDKISKSQSEIIHDALQEVVEVHGIMITRMNVVWIDNMDGGGHIGNVSIEANLR